MNLTGLGVGAFLGGLAALVIALGGLHLLRVRMRRQVVDSLLFFRSAALQARPRVLGRRLARLGSFLLAAAVVALVWTSFAIPFGSDTAPSRMIVVDRSASSAALDEQGGTSASRFAGDAARIAAGEALGPRGGVIAVDGRVRAVLRADEPVTLLAERIDAVATGGDQTRLLGAMIDAAHQLRSGDEIVVIGGPTHLPTTVDGIAVRRAAIRDAQLEPVDTPARSSPRVFVDADLPPALEFAVEALGLERTSLFQSDFAVVLAGTTIPADKPAIVLVTRGDATVDELRLTRDCPASLSMRDRTRGRTLAFALADGETPWICDPHDEFALAAATATRVRAVSSLFDDLAHRDVPLLVEAAVRHLTGYGSQAAATPRPAPAREADDLTAFTGSAALAPALLTIALLLLALDAWLLGRGRIA